MIFPFFQKIGFWGILGPPSYGIGATIRMGREMLCLPYAGFLFTHFLSSILFNWNHGGVNMGPYNVKCDGARRIGVNYILRLEKTLLSLKMALYFNSGRYL
jgi:hypothetical protein